MMLLKAKGFKWESCLPLEERDGLWLVKPEDMRRFLEKIAYTHDTMSGGFDIEINQSE